MFQPSGVGLESPEMMRTLSSVPSVQGSERRFSYRFAMSPGIFISYSREDEKHAMHLLALLRREGYSVWIDQEAIAGASIWSDEIVQNIKTSEIFIALLSESSAASPNVAKEIALAAEHGKIILPIEIGSVELPGRLEYALAGIQKTNFHDEEAILRALKSQVVKLEGAQAAAGGSERSKFSTRRAHIRMMAGIAALVVIGVVLFLAFRPGPKEAEMLNPVVVLPFATVNLDQDRTQISIFSPTRFLRSSRRSIPLQRSAHRCLLHIAIPGLMHLPSQKNCMRGLSSRGWFANRTMSILFLPGSSTQRAAGRYGKNLTW